MCRLSSVVPKSKFLQLIDSNWELDFVVGEINRLFEMAPQDGIEPPTVALTGRSSTTELLRNETEPEELGQRSSRRPEGISGLPRAKMHG
jgi:hypothetical protein